MSSDIRSILQKLTALEESQAITPVGVKHGLNKQQKSVHQLPALFKPHSIKALGAKTDPQHPMHGELVGDSVVPKKPSLGEAMQEVEEDMLSKVKKDLTQYLDQLEKKVKVDRALKDKALDAVGRHEVEEDPTQQDLDVVAPEAPQQDPTLPEAAPVNTIALEDGCILEIHGNDVTGFEIRNGERSLPTRFPNLEHAKMAVDLYRGRKPKSDSNQDYIEER
jgi:hypothetical protein